MRGIDATEDSDIEMILILYHLEVSVYYVIGFIKTVLKGTRGEI